MFYKYNSKNTPENAPESGSAIIYIFIGVALFGALIFMFSRGGSQNTNSMTAQRANISTSAIIDYTRSLNSAIQKLLMNGCSEDQISFENPIVSGYTNSNAPSDKSCHVFDTSGGKMLYPSLPDAVFYATIFRRVMESDGTDLYAVFQITSLEICNALNKKFGVYTDDRTSATIAMDNITPTTKFTGSYSGPGDLPDDGGDASGYSGKLAACYKANGDGKYYFYYSLIQR